MLPQMDTSELDRDPYWLVVILRRERKRITQAGWLTIYSSFTKSYHDPNSEWYRKAWAALALAYIADQLNRANQSKLNII